MKNLPLFAPIAAVVATVLFLAGCAAPQSARVTRVQAVPDFTVVESFTQKELTPAQLAELREAVINYLQEQGLASNRLYYVKVSFPAENAGDEAQWAIVRIGNLPTRTYTILAAYPGPDDYFPNDYYRYGYYTGYDGFARYGYYDPFDYNYGGYSRPVPPPRDHGKPDYPTGTRTRWDGTPRTDPDNSRGSNNPPRTGNTDRGPRDPDRNRHDDGNRSWGGSSSPRGDSGNSYTPPPAPVRSDPAPRNESPSPAPSSRDKSDTPTNEK